MIAPIWKQLPTGRMVDLMAPAAFAVDFAGDVAPALANIARFDGSCAERPGKPWTVLDHLVAGADLLRANGGSPRLALLFLLHDAHEAYLGDITSPVAAALAATANRECPGKPGHPAGHFVDCAIRSLKASWDCAIWQAALTSPPTQAEAKDIKTHDLRLMMTERNHMMAQPWRNWGPLENLAPLRVASGALRPGKPEARITAFLERLDAWAPQARARACPSTLSTTLPTPARAKGARA
jgi:hypothetical protein